MKLSGDLGGEVGRYTMICRSEYWVVDRKIQLGMCIAKMRILRRTSGVIREHRIKNNYIRGNIGIR